MDMSLSKLQELVMDREAGTLQSTGSQRVGHYWVTELNWTDIMNEGKLINIGNTVSSVQS